MSASFYDLLKYAATGIAAPDMTYYDRMRASTIMGGVIKTLTGQPPLTFKAGGTPLISWSMKGNGEQSGTPTPDAPIMPTFCGVRTGNLFDKSNTNLIFNGTSLATENEWYGAGGIGKVIRIPCNPSTTYTISGESDSSILRISMIENEDIPDLGFGVDCIDVLKATSVSTQTFTTTANTKYILVQVSSAAFDDYINVLMLNAGSTALPYEPFGWAEKITCAGQTVPVYLGQVQTVRRVKKLVLTGEEGWRYDGSTFYINISSMTEPVIPNSPLYCSHFVNSSQGMRNGTNWAFVTKYETVTTAPAWKSYLAQQYANGTPVTVWYVLAEPTTGISNEPLAKIGDYADELSSTDAGVAIPTVKGNNVLTIDGDLQPSEMTITFTN